MDRHPDAPESARSRRTALIALATLVILIAGAAAVWYFAVRAAAPETAYEPDLEPIAGTGEAQVFVGCVGQTGEPDTFMLTVSRVEEPEPLPPGSVVPRKTRTRAGVPLTGGTPDRPRVAGTGEPPEGGTPLTRTTSYVLVGAGGLELRDHLGHTIEVTGVLDRREDLEFARLAVRSAKHVAEDCGEP